ncbi:hypothetical protein [Nocardioides sp. URHA0020]|uniref:hypothetical protein n=1 Tax=Nocardioides sp. URHA0020 TaxID=1380392 RepID=UPI001E50AF5D|nr:hypothetical protein [Nocardioides sp. URHA0020]
MRVWVSAVLAAVVVTGPGRPAHADDEVDIAPVTGGVSIGMTHEFPGSASDGSPEESDVFPAADVLVVDAGADLEKDFCVGVNWTTGCVPEPEVEPEVEVTPGRVARAFQRLPLPAAELVVQPPKGRTLVNFETNFYTERGEFTRTVRLLGRRVELRIWPASFGWRFGDGQSQRSTSPGAAYPDLEITHRYLQEGRVSPSVDTTYAAQFRVGGGPWRDVAGTVTIAGSPQSLRVVEARPVLVGG